jgi:glutathione S-transferase
MILHWSPKSPFVRKVMIGAHELGLRGRIECVRSIALTTQPNTRLMGHNPLSKIPTLLLDDGTVLFDSRVILEYFDCLVGGGQIIPIGGRQRWLSLRRQALADGLLDVSLLLRQERERGEQQRSSDHWAAFELKIEASLTRFEEEVAALAATRFDVAHIALGCALGYLDFRFANLAWRRGRPALTAWFETFCERPSARQTAIVDDLKLGATPASRGQ